MIAILSPAKNMRAVQKNMAVTKPTFLAQSAELAERLRRFAPWELEDVLRVNPEIALRAFAYYQDFTKAAPSPAIMTYWGLAYQYLDAASFSQEDTAFAQEHLCLLSALYGVLRPLDGICPYRLEMNSRLMIDGKNLYRYWGGAWRNLLFQKQEIIVNLASAEYSSVVSRWMTEQDRMIDCVFLNPNRGVLKQLPAPAKMARGKMARFIIQNKIERTDALKAFDWDGYQFIPTLSGKNRFVYARTAF